MEQMPIRLADLRGLTRWFVTSFLIVVSLGYTTGIYFVAFTTHVTPQGTVHEFRGNEDLPLGEAGELKYPKSDLEMLNIIHAHVTSFALIFFAVGGIFLLSSYSPKLKALLAIEPFAATLVLFGGMAGIRYLPASWALVLGVVMMIAGLSTFAAVAAMTGLSIYEMWKSDHGLERR